MKTPKRNYQRWDGKIKNYTRDCDGCNFYREIDNKKICGWGVAFKILEKTDKLRKCEIKNRTPVERPSVKYLDNLIINEDLTKLK